MLAKFILVLPADYGNKVLYAEKKISTSNIVLGEHNNTRHSYEKPHNVEHTFQKQDKETLVSYWRNLVNIILET